MVTVSENNGFGVTVVLRIIHGVQHVFGDIRIETVFQWCCSGVAVVLQWCCSGVTAVLQRFCSGVAVVLQWSYP
jgi:hypothetical protein